MNNEQRNETLKELRSLEAEARRLSWKFPGELGASLRASPEYIVFEGQSDVDVRYHTPAGHNRVYKRDEVEGAEEIIALTNKIRSARLRVAKSSG